MPSGLDDNGTKLLSNAKSNGLNVNLVNIMTMDYYDGTRDMGKAATDAATALRNQLGAIWPEKSDAQLWAMEGNTPMIGVNDDTSEIFTTGNATTLANFAKSKGIQELAFWALGRDKACATNGQLSDSCSGTPQSAWQFSSVFNTVTGGGTTPPPTGSTGQITGLGGKCVDVAAASSANGTAVQMYDCNGTTAQQWTVGTDGTVRALGKCMDLTAAGTANGTKVQLYDCNGTGAQVWQPGSGDTLVNPASGKCLDVTDKSTANGARLQIWTCAAWAPTSSSTSRPDGPHRRRPAHRGTAVRRAAACQDRCVTDDQAPVTADALRERMRSAPVLAGPLPSFDPDGAGPEPGPLFARWLAYALDDGVPEPHVMTLSTADAAWPLSARCSCCAASTSTAPPSTSPRTPPAARAATWRSAPGPPSPGTGRGTAGRSG